VLGGDLEAFLVGLVAPLQEVSPASVTEVNLGVGDAERVGVRVVTDLVVDPGEAVGEECHPSTESGGPVLDEVDGRNGFLAPLALG